MSIIDAFMLALYLGGALETFAKGRRVKADVARSALAAFVWPAQLGAEIVRRVRSDY